MHSSEAASTEQGKDKKVPQAKEQGKLREQYLESQESQQEKPTSEEDNAEPKKDAEENTASDKKEGFLGTIVSKDERIKLNVRGEKVFGENDEYLGTLKRIKQRGAKGEATTYKLELDKEISSITDGWTFIGKEGDNARIFSQGIDTTSGHITFNDSAGKERYEIINGAVVDKDGKQICLITPPKRLPDGQVVGGQLTFLAQSGNAEIPLALKRGAVIELYGMDDAARISANPMSLIALGGEIQADGQLKASKQFLDLSALETKELQRLIETNQTEAQLQEQANSYSLSNLFSNPKDELSKLSRQKQERTSTIDYLNKVIKNGDGSENAIAELQKIQANQSPTSDEYDYISERKRLDTWRSELEKLPEDVTLINGKVTSFIPTEDGKVEKRTCTIRDGNFIDEITGEKKGSFVDNKGHIVLFGRNADKPESAEITAILTEMKALRGAIWDLEYTPKGGVKKEAHWISAANLGLLSQADLDNRAETEHMFSTWIDIQTGGIHELYDSVASQNRKQEFQKELDKIFKGDFKTTEELQKSLEYLIEGPLVHVKAGASLPSKKETEDKVPEIKDPHLVNAQVRVNDRIFEINEGQVFAVKEGKKGYWGELTADYKLKEAKDERKTESGQQTDLETIDLKDRKHRRILMAMSIKDEVGQSSDQRYQLAAFNKPGDQTKSYGLTNMKVFEQQAKQEVEIGKAVDKEYHDRRTWFVGLATEHLLTDKRTLLADQMRNIEIAKTRLGRNNQELFLNGFDLNKTPNKMLDGKLGYAGNRLSDIRAQITQAQELAAKSQEVEHAAVTGVAIAGIAVGGVAAKLAVQGGAELLGLALTETAETAIGTAALGTRVHRLALAGAELVAETAAGATASVVARGSNASSPLNNAYSGAIEALMMKMPNKYMGTNMTLKDAERIIRAGAPRAGASVRELAEYAALRNSVTGRILARGIEASGSAAGKEAAQLAMSEARGMAQAARVTYEGGSTAVQVAGYNAASAIREGKNPTDLLTKDAVALGTATNLAGGVLSRYVSPLFKTKWVRAYTSGTVNNFTSAALDTTATAIAQDDARIQAGEQTGRNWGRVLGGLARAGAAGAWFTPATIAAHSLTEPDSPEPEKTPKEKLSQQIKHAEQNIMTQIGNLQVRLITGNIPLPRQTRLRTDAGDTAYGGTHSPPSDSSTDTTENNSNIPTNSNTLTARDPMQGIRYMRPMGPDGEGVGGFPRSVPEETPRPIEGGALEGENQPRAKLPWTSSDSPSPEHTQTVVDSLMLAAGELQSLTPQLKTIRTAYREAQQAQKTANQLAKDIASAAGCSVDYVDDMGPTEAERLGVKTLRDQYLRQQAIVEKYNQDRQLLQPFKDTLEDLLHDAIADFNMPRPKVQFEFGKSNDNRAVYDPATRSIRLNLNSLIDNKLEYSDNPQTDRLLTVVNLLTEELQHYKQFTAMAALAIHKATKLSDGNKITESEWQNISQEYKDRTGESDLTREFADEVKLARTDRPLTAEEIAYAEKMSVARRDALPIYRRLYCADRIQNTLEKIQSDFNRTGTVSPRDQRSLNEPLEYLGIDASNLMNVISSLQTQPSQKQAKQQLSAAIAQLRQEVEVRHNEDYHPSYLRTPMEVEAINAASAATSEASRRINQSQSTDAASDRNSVNPTSYNEADPPPPITGGAPTGNEQNKPLEQQLADYRTALRQDVESRAQARSRLAQTDADAERAQLEHTISALDDSIRSNIVEQNDLIRKEINTLYEPWEEQIKQLEDQRTTLQTSNPKERKFPFNTVADAVNKVQQRRINNQLIAIRDEMVNKGVKDRILALQRQHTNLEIAIAAENDRVSDIGMIFALDPDTGHLSRTAASPYRYRNSGSPADGAAMDIHNGAVPIDNVLNVLESTGRLPQGSGTRFNFDALQSVEALAMYGLDGSLYLFGMGDRRTPLQVQSLSRHEIGHAIEIEYFMALTDHEREPVERAYSLWLDDPTTQRNLASVPDDLQKVLSSRKYVFAHENKKAYLASFSEMFAELRNVHEFSKTEEGKNLPYSELLEKARPEYDDDDRVEMMGNAEPLYNILKGKVFEPYDNGAPVKGTPGDVQDILSDAVARSINSPRYKARASFDPTLFDDNNPPLPIAGGAPNEKEPTDKPIIGSAFTTIDERRTNAQSVTDAMFDQQFRLAVISEVKAQIATDDIRSLSQLRGGLDIYLERSKELGDKLARTFKKVLQSKLEERGLTLPDAVNVASVVIRPISQTIRAGSTKESQLYPKTSSNVLADAGDRLIITGNSVNKLANKPAIPISSESLRESVDGTQAYHKIYQDLFRLAQTERRDPNLPIAELRAQAEADKTIRVGMYHTDIALATSERPKEIVEATDAPSQQPTQQPIKTMRDAFKAGLMDAVAEHLARDPSAEKLSTQQGNRNYRMRGTSLTVDDGTGAKSIGNPKGLLLDVIDEMAGTQLDTPSGRALQDLYYLVKTNRLPRELAQYRDFEGGVSRGVPIGPVNREMMDNLARRAIEITLKKYIANNFANVDRNALARAVQNWQQEGNKVLIAPDSETPAPIEGGAPTSNYETLHAELLRPENDLTPIADSNEGLLRRLTPEGKRIGWQIRSKTPEGRRIERQIRDEFLIPYAQQAASRLGIDPALINRRNVQIENADNERRGAYRYNKFSLYLNLYNLTTAEEAQTAVDHEMRHMQISLQRTAAHNADPESYKAMMTEQWLAKAGTNSYRPIKFAPLGPHVLENQTARNQYRDLLRQASIDLGLEKRPTKASVKAWLKQQTIGEELTQEFSDSVSFSSSNDALCYQIQKEFEYYINALNKSIIPSAVVDRNPKLHDSITKEANRFKAWQDGAEERKLSDNPKFKKITNDIFANADAVENIGVLALPAQYGAYFLAPEEIAARRFHLTQALRRTLAGAEADESIGEQRGSIYANVTAEKLIRAYSKAYSSPDGQVDDSDLQEAKKYAYELARAGYTSNEDLDIFLIAHLYDLDLLTDEDVDRLGYDIDDLP